MREEIETGMRLLGVTSLDQLTPDLIRYVDRGSEGHELNRNRWYDNRG